jgi:hypothetical protein
MVIAAISPGMKPDIPFLANRLAKKSKNANGSLILTDPNPIVAALKRTGVGDIRGVGRQSNWFLQNYGINNAYPLRNATDSWIKKHLSVGCPILPDCQWPGILLELHSRSWSITFFPWLVLHCSGIALAGRPALVGAGNRSVPPGPAPWAAPSGTASLQYLQQQLYVPAARSKGSATKRLLSRPYRWLGKRREQNTALSGAW